MKVNPFIAGLLVVALLGVGTVPGIAHGAASPVKCWLNQVVVTSMTVVALVGRLERADLVGLRARLLDVGRYDVGSENEGGVEKE